MKITKSMTKERILDHFDGMPSELVAAGEIVKVLREIEGGYVSGVGYRDASETRRRALKIAAAHFNLSLG